MSSFPGGDRRRSREATGVAPATQQSACWYAVRPDFGARQSAKTPVTQPYGCWLAQHLAPTQPKSSGTAVWRRVQRHEPLGFRPSPPLGFRPSPSLGFRPSPPLGFRPSPPLGFRPSAPLGFRPSAPLG